MSGPVDVLRVLLCVDAHFAGGSNTAADKAVLDALDDARVAVAELIAERDALVKELRMASEGLSVAASNLAGTDIGIIVADRALFARHALARVGGGA